MCQIVRYTTRFEDGIVHVVRAVHDEFGFSWDPDGYHRDLYDIEASYLEHGGMFWVLVARDTVVGTCGLTIHDRACELHRLYVLPAYRGQGWGGCLMEVAMEHGRDRGCGRIIAWSDVKLGEAHALYRKAGFTQEGERICADPDKSREWGFWKEPF